MTAHASGPGLDPAARHQPEPLEGFQPAPFQIVSEPHQLKAFADPLRNRILHILADREATNQQLAVALGQSQAKVLHHVRVLLDTGLIVLVAERIKGGNVEKFYRATARIYGIRAKPDEESSITGPVFEGLLQEIVASEARWPEQPQSWELRRARLAPERVAEFTTRINALIGEYWGNGIDPAPDDPGAPLMAFASVTFRHPIDAPADAPPTSDTAGERE
ncbi:MAG: ArsR/SmtB family transcription factor [Thermomicrobiales bacterium]